LHQGINQSLPVGFRFTPRSPGGSEILDKCVELLFKLLVAKFSVGSGEQKTPREKLIRLSIALYMFKRHRSNRAYRSIIAESKEL